MNLNSKFKFESQYKGSSATQLSRAAIQTFKYTPKKLSKLMSSHVKQYYTVNKCNHRPQGTSNH